MNNYQCIGCGALIQTENADAMGYLPASAFQKGLEKGEFYCQRCFRLRHYNELQDIEVSDDVFLEKLSNIAEDTALVVYVIDLFDIEGSLIHGLPRFIGKQPFIVVANKVDLLPKVTNYRRLRHWMNVVLNANGLYPEDILLLSATKKSSLKPLTNIIEQVIQHRNVYIVGVTNVGKSTLINQLIHYYGGEKSIITTSNHPGTTLDMIEIPMNDQHCIVDTPGIIRRTQLAHYLSREDIKKVLPTKPLKPKTYQLNAEQTIFLAGLVRMDFVKGPRASFTFYVSNEIYIHRTKLSQADRIFEEHQGELLSPPHKEDLASFPELIPKKLHLKSNQDVAISGLGWLTVNESVEIIIWVPKGVHVLVRDSII